MSLRRFARGLKWGGATLVFVLLLAVLWALLRPLGPATTSPLEAPSAEGNDRFLIVGLTQDERRTDMIMVLQWDGNRGMVRVLGVPRDLPVIIAGIGTTKLVHAYAVGGIARARATVEQVLGIPIRHYFVFSLPATRRLVDLIGGVPITVEKRMRYTDRAQGLMIDLQPGAQVLDGTRAEQYLRFRNDSEGDIGRIRRQQQFLRAALAAARRPAVWVRLPQIIQAARAEVDSDLTALQLLGWLRRVEGVTPERMSAATIKGQSVVLWDELAQMKLYFWQPDPEDLRTKVHWLLTGDVPSQPKP